MKKCPKCNNISNDNAKFCSVCGFDFQKSKRKILSDILFICLIVFCVFIVILVYNYVFEQKNLQPSELKTKWGDYNATCTISYDKDTKKSQVDIQTDNVIESWQVNLAKDANVKKEDLLVINLSVGKTSMNLKADNTVFGANKKFSTKYYIPNTSAKEFMQLKSDFQNNNVTWNYRPFLGFDKKQRKQLKEQYLQVKEQERLQRLYQQQQEALRRQYYNYYWGGYY